MFKGFCLLIISVVLSVAAMLSLWAVFDYLFDTHVTTDLLRDISISRGALRSGSKPDIHLTNPLKDAAMDEPKTDAPAPVETPTEEEPLISSTTTGAGEEFDYTKTLNRPLTWWEKRLARKARKIALNNGWNYAPLEDAEKIGTHLITVVTKGAEAGEFAGIYYRDTPLEEWEKQLARTLLELARENGSEDQK